MRVQHEEPQAAAIVSVGLAMTSVCLLSSFLSINIMLIGLATQRSFVVTLVYLDSFFFIIISAVLRFGLANVQMTASRCKITDIVCLTVYLSTKLIYFFLIEKACMLHGRTKPRLDSKSWLLNMLAMSGSRFTTVESGVCIVNGKLEALLGIVLWDIGAKVYLSSLFLMPLWNWFYLQRSSPSPVARRTMIRFLVGLASLLAAAIVNGSVLATIHGDPMWVCMLTCTSDIIYASAVVHWTTLHDRTEAGPPPLVISNVEYAVDNSHPSARSRRNTMSATALPEWLRPSNSQAPASGQSLIGMLSEDDDKELRFAHHRSLLEIERRSSKGGPLGAGRLVAGGGSASRPAPEEAIDSKQAQVMVAEWNKMSGSSEGSPKAVDRRGHMDKGKGAAVAVDRLEEAEGNNASETWSLSRPGWDGTSKARGKRPETHGSVRRVFEHVKKDGMRSRKEDAHEPAPGL
ncbi:hypothetical protein KVR01_008180 [Diaporthe batatas]|uniref:uncharacterized protein n=1 Tax=Diaporthe batatas TaxID=748121 RepID=UPI001D0570C7|nr:uncharacterized protein KVR01_008180 [Diaporthe batatas]KAG8162415.1 hypothetical protein KVR01_008180 [Diaporthe batatas]